MPNNIPISSEVSLQNISDPNDQILSFIQAYYLEDHHENILAENVQKTIEHFSQFPDQGGIYFIHFQGKNVGYCILVNFWSNEYGGNILSLDEIYIVPDFRGKGIAKTIIQFLIDTKFNDAQAHQLVVNRHNEYAYSIYKKLGFSEYEGKLMMYEYPSV